MTVLALTRFDMTQTRGSVSAVAFTNCILDDFFGDWLLHELAPSPLGHGSFPALGRWQTEHTSPRVRATLGSKLAMDARASRN